MSEYAETTSRITKITEQKEEQKKGVTAGRAKQAEISIFEGRKHSFRVKKEKAGKRRNTENAKISQRDKAKLSQSHSKSKNEEKRDKKQAFQEQTSVLK